MTRGDTVLIRTPEGIEFALPLAGPFSRMLAFAVDLAAIAAVGMVLGYVISLLRIVSEDAAQAVSAVLYFAVSLLYGILTEWLWRGQTVGKRLLGLRVVEASGLRLRPAQVVIRNLLRFVDLLPGLYLVGGIACIWSPSRQRLGDLAAGTIVIRTSRFEEPDVEQVLGIKFNSLGEHRHLAARLRHKVRPEIAHLALEAVLRRDEIQPASRLVLFREIADYFREIVPFPDEVSEQLSDEKYVRDVVDILFRRSAGEAAKTGGDLRNAPVAHQSR